MAVLGHARVVGRAVRAGSCSVGVRRPQGARAQHMREENQPGGRPGYDFATVILEAPADKVFATALAMARKNTAVRVVMQDPGQRRLQITDGDRTATLNVVPFSDDVSQLLIAGQAAPARNSASRVRSLARRAARTVCKEMNKECQVGG